MAVFKVVFTSKNSLDEETPSFKKYTYRIEAKSADEAIGLAQIEFSQKLPELAYADYVPKVTAADGKESRIVQTFPDTKTFNPDP